MKQNDFYEVDGCMDFIPITISETYADGFGAIVSDTIQDYRLLVEQVYRFTKVKEPQKVVVPKFVAEWIEELKKSHSNLAWVWQVYPNEPKVKNWLESNTEKFMRAWLDGYEVEKEKLYTVEIPNPNGSGYSKIYLARNKDGKVELFTWSCYTSIEFANDWKQEDNAQLTESEIKQDFEWAWDAGFAEEVEVD